MAKASKHPGDEDQGKLKFVETAERFRPLLIRLVAVITLIMAAWMLRNLAFVAVPFVAALFVALAVAPVNEAVRKRMPRGLGWLGYVAAMSVVAVVLIGFFAGIYMAAQQAAGQLPNLTEELRSALPGAADSASQASGAGQTGGATVPQAEGGVDAHAMLQRVGAYLGEHAASFGSAVLGSATRFLTGLGLVFFLVLLMLVEAPTWREKASNALSLRQEVRWESSLAVMARTFRWYVLVRIALGTVTALLYAGWLMIFGVDLLIVWGVLALLLNFIPTLGSLLAGALPVVYVLVSQDLTTALIVALGILVIEQVMGNYIDPLVQGKQLSVSPLVTFLALLLFGWMWGVVGALLAVPMAAFLVILCAHTPGLQSAALLLSNCRDMEGLREMTRA